ncbi:MAG: methyltransferase domain-containing protein [Planctomycetota bacterium]
MTEPNLTDRQRREREYFKGYAEGYKDRPRVRPPGFYDMIESGKRRWWDHRWAMYTPLLRENIRNKKALVVGCGGGADAFRLCKMGAEVHAFDLSPDMVAHARGTAAMEGVNPHFKVMPAESMEYQDNFFDCVVVAGVLHHCNIPQVLGEIRRVSKSRALVVIDEPYAHTAVQKIRHSRFVEEVVYPRAAEIVLKDKELISSPDEAKLTQHDVAYIVNNLQCARFRYFKLLSNRLFPDRMVPLVKMDRIILALCQPIAHFFAGRVLIEGRVGK